MRIETGLLSTQKHVFLADFFIQFLTYILVPLRHGLRTPNEGINQSYLKIWADVADKICFGRTYKFGSGSEFSAVQ